MRCLVCNSNEWENVDEFRVLKKHEGKAVGMSLCQKCGFVSYPEKYKTDEEIREYYRNEYRGGAPGYGNLVTGHRKIGYHAKFLKEVILKWKDEGMAPVIGEVGSALGMVLNWFRTAVPDCEVHGVELTKTYKRVAYHEYGLELKDDLDLSKKYDLIMSYKVAEHQVDVDLRIREYAEALTDGGYLYISVPTWFNALTNPGVAGHDLEYYYHTDHINVWTRVLFEEVLRKSGLKICKVERVVYGDTYLCKRDDSVMNDPPQYEDPKQIKAVMSRIKAAHDLMGQGKAKEALEVWGNFPDAWQLYYEKSRAELHKKHNGNGQQIAEVFCNEMVSACGDTLDTKTMAADILSRYGHLVQAIELFEAILDIRPNCTRSLFSLSNCFRKLAQKEPDEFKRAKLILTARDICRKIISIDEQARPEAFNWALRDEAEIDPEIYKAVIASEQTQTK